MRLFFAIPLDTSAITALAAVQDEMKHQFRHSQVSWVAPKNFHITLHFFGDIPYQIKNDRCLFGTVSNIIECTQQQTFPAPFEIRLTHADAFPSKKDPQTLLVHAQVHPSLFGVYKRLGDVLASLGFDVDERPFRPHVTLGRVRSRAEVLKPELIDVNASFTADRVILFESQLNTNGSVYKPLSCFSLCPTSKK